MGLAEAKATLGLVTPKKKQKAPSLFEQVRGAVAGVVPGAVTLGGLIAKEATAPVRAGIDVVRGEASPQEALGAVLRGGNVGGSIAAGLLGGNNPVARAVGGAGSLLAPATERYQPASLSQGESFRHTYEDVIHPSRFAQASQQGQIVGKLLEDVGNASLVAGAAAPLLKGAAEGATAGSLTSRAAGRAAEIAARTESLGAKGVNALTVSPYRLGLRAVGKGAQSLLEAAPESFRVATSAAKLLDPVLRSEKGLANEGAVRGRQAGDLATKEVAGYLKQAGSADLFEAARAKMLGLDEPIREAVAAGRPVDPQFMADVFPDQVAGHAVRPEVAQILADYHAGTLPPEVAKVLDETSAAMTAGEQTRTVKALAGEGFSRTGGQLDPAHLGNAPITPEIDRLTAQRERVDTKLGGKVQVAERQLRRAVTAEKVPEDFTRKDVVRTVMTEGRQRRAGLLRPGQPVPAEAGASVLSSDLGVKREATSLVRPVTERARTEGEALGLAKAADDTARRAARTTVVGRQQLLAHEGGILGRRATAAQGRALATGDLTEAALSAQAEQAGSSFAAGRRAEQASVRRRTAEQKLTEARDVHAKMVAELDTKIEAARRNPQNYPARWRPVMEANSRWAEHLKSASKNAGTPQDAALLAQMAHDVPLLPDELAAAGLDPQHVTQGYVADVRREQTAARASDNIAPERKLAAEHERQAGSLIPMAPGKVAEMERSQAMARARNQVIQGVLEPQRFDAAGNAVMDPATNTPVGYSRSARSVLRQDFDQVVNDARAFADSEKPGDAAHAKRRVGEAVFKAMQEKGWEAWNPADEALLAHPPMVDPESTLFLKNGSAAMLREYLAPKDAGPVLEAMQTINRKWKGLVLPFSVRWQIGDAVGNALMAWGGGGIDPATLASRFKEAREAIARGEIPDRVTQNTLATDDPVLLGLREEAKPPRTPIGKGLKAVQDRAFKLNHTINSIERSAYYLERLDRLGGEAAPGAVEQAIRDANRTMGDFANLSPFERRYMTQALPFWSWIRHITRLTGRVAIDNPARLVFGLRLSAVYADDQTQLPGWAQGGLPIGNNVIPLGGLNPFADVFGGPAAPVSTSGGFGGANVLRALSPAIQVPFAALTGKNLKRESFELTTPTGSVRKDEYGKAVPTPLLGRPGALLSYIADQVPIAKSVRGLLPSVGSGSLNTGPAIRYDTGEAYRKGRKPMQPDSVVSPRADTAARLLLPFFPQVVNAPKQKAIAIKRLRSG